MKKLYKKLTDEQRQRGVIMTSCLSTYTQEQPNDTLHEVLNTDEDKDIKMNRLLDDSFFNNSHWKYNIVRR